MPKTDGYKTRLKLLQVAEQLFSEKGFDGTSIDKIAKAAGVNKGLIYYHFKDKNHIVVSILQGIIEELDDLMSAIPGTDQKQQSDSALRDKIRGEIEYCMKRKKIISVMLMESMKSDDQSDFLFRCAEIVMENELSETGEKLRTNGNFDEEERRKRFLVHEFFTGFIPIVTFVALQDKWCQYFKCSKEEALDFFLDSFYQTHLISHPQLD